MKTKGISYWDKKLIGTGGVLNEYVKWRDATDFTPEGKPIAPCITCKSPVKGSNLHAGHWVGRRHKGVAYDEHNVHAQCGMPCNKYRSGEPQMYEDELREMYGDEEVDRIRSWVGKVRKWTPTELEELYHEYKQKLEELKQDYK
jgi:hypothetical protein